ncbi:MAG: thiamine pyrophosphate-dependent enzyme [candidate division KSB1 bacterium]|nr:thiamine pyrophosphate-dependent enzyme [candidate division KSB1 bacterium]MDZ7346398.1 thiamine pyrophosphate-dependent enzyme [candidate division KSB1 bacterium]
MTNRLLNDKSFPYCPGCGHGLILKALDAAFQALDLDPLNAVIVSDIGCCGLIDALVNSHTVHGLHGRSTALAQGIAMAAAGSGKKVIAVLGDGGASIGLQHILTAARWNVEMLVILHNNMVYGMTGGQRSALSPPNLRADGGPQPLDVCALAAAAGAQRVIRRFADDDLTAAFIELLKTRGCSLIEVLETCPSHGLRKYPELRQAAVYPPIDAVGSFPIFTPGVRQTPSLLDEIPAVPSKFTSSLQRQLQVTVAGSAGEGVQSAGEIAALAAMRCGLEVQKRGEYPITVGNGFSLVHLTFSPQPICYADALDPDIILAVSEEGWKKVKSRIRPGARLLADAELQIEQGGMEQPAFRRVGGAKGAALAALVYWGERTKIIPFEAFNAAVSSHRLGKILQPLLEKSRGAWFGDA